MRLVYCLTILAILIAGSFLMRERILAQQTSIRLEAEECDRYDDEFSLVPPRTLIRQGVALSGGMASCVRSKDTGEPTWIEWDIEIPATGVYKVLVRSGGNDSGQAGYVSVDGGQPVMVIDVEGRGNVSTQEMRKQAENLFVTIEVGNVLLSRGRHRLRLSHTGKAGYSNSFGVDYVELQRQPDGAKVTFQAGKQAEPVGGRPKRRTLGNLRLTLELDFAFHGQGEDALATVTVSNFSDKPVSGLRCRLQLASANLRKKKKNKKNRNLMTLGIPVLAPRSDWATVKVVKTGALPLGEYTLSAALKLSDKVLATDSASLIIERYPVPTWVRRGRLLWQHSWTSRYPYWVSIETMLQQIHDYHQMGASVIDNQCCQDYYYGPPPSYPQVRDFQPLVDEVHNLGMKYIWYQTAVTTSEYFWYRHRDWSTSPPFYHCGWLSMSPAAKLWSEYLADDLANLVVRSGIDGVMLDNASSTEWTDALDEETFRIIGRHLTTVRDRMKAAKPNSALIPNYGILSPLGMKYPRYGWDAQITEGTHPAPSDRVSGYRQTVKDFVMRYSSARKYSGKPIFALMYAPTEFGKLCMAACAAARVNPASGWGKEYLPFIARWDEYIHSQNVTELPEGYITAEPDDLDTVVVGFQKIHPSGVRDWVIQCVNAAMKDKEPLIKPVTIRVNLPAAMPTRQGFLLRPESQEVQRVTFTDENGLPTLRFNAPVWSLIVLADELAPFCNFVPASLRVAVGETASVKARFFAPPNAIARSEWRLSARSPARSSDRSSARLLIKTPRKLPVISGEATAVISFTADRTAKPGIREVWVDVTYGRRVASTPIEVEVTDPLLVKLKPDWFQLPPPKPHVSNLTLTNMTSQTAKGVCRLRVPSGFKVTPSSVSFEIAPRASEEIALDFRMPKGELSDFFAIEDHPLTVNIKSNVGNVTRIIPLRLTQTIVRTITCTFGSPGGEVLKTGAGDVPLSQMLGPLRAWEFDRFDDAMRQAMRQIDEGPVPCLWLRVGAKTTQLGDYNVIAALEAYVRRGGALLIQENLFAASEQNRAFFKSDVCPIEEPYDVLEEAEPWLITLPNHPAIAVYANLVRLGDNQIPFPQPVIRCKVKPWARVISTTKSGQPAIVVSDDPRRPVAYIAGLFKGNYLDITQRYRRQAPKDQMTELITLYIELMRWLGMQAARSKGGH